MVYCCIVGCFNRSDRGPDSRRNLCSNREGDHNVSFYRIPAIIRNQGKLELELSKRRRDGFVAAISREDLDLNDLDKYRVCSNHFVSGKPANLTDRTSCDWLPTTLLGHTKTLPPTKAHSERYERAQRRNEEQTVKERIYQNTAEVVSEEVVHLIVKEEVTKVVKQTMEEVQVVENSTVKVMERYILEFIESSLAEFAKEAMEAEYIKFAEAKCNYTATISSLQNDLAKCHCTIDKLSLQIKQMSTPFGSEETLFSDEKVSLLTGLPNFKILKTVYNHVVATMPVEGTGKLSLFQQFICSLMKLRLNCPGPFLASLFDVSAASVSRLFLKWLTQMDIRLQDLIIWPDRKSLHKTMPECFRESFGKKVAIIIDCFEIFIERPSNLQARTSTWSNYKHKNTAKVLIGILPQGVVGFVSEAWGGRVSDKYLTEHCGILRKLLPGDVVLADRGFDIAESVGSMQAKLHIPAFTKGKTQLSAVEVEETRKIANVRIHVERVIGAVRQRFPILQSTLPIHYVMKRNGEDIPLIDRMVRVCCALNNVCNSVVPFD